VRGGLVRPNPLHLGPDGADGLCGVGRQAALVAQTLVRGLGSQQLEAVS